MKVAGITITYDDEFKLKEWYEHYINYKDDLYIHIIIDNNSNNNFKSKLKDLFKESFIIERDTNGGCTGAYNDGIRKALSIPEVDSIMLIANDFKINSGATKILYDTLFSNQKLGMIAPIWLKPNSNIIEDYGCNISTVLQMEEKYVGNKIEDVHKEINYCGAVAGGLNLSKREFYEKVGLQDEKLFMYSDEVDMGIRAKKNGYTIASIKNAIVCHEHINKDSDRGRREPYTKYLSGRNKVYLAKKHFGALKVICVFSFYFFGAFFKIITNTFKLNSSIVQDYLWMMLGSFMGFIGNMSSNRFSKPSE